MFKKMKIKNIIKYMYVYIAMINKDQILIVTPQNSEHNI